MNNIYKKTEQNKSKVIKCLKMTEMTKFTT